MPSIVKRKSNNRFKNDYNSTETVNTDLQKSGENREEEKYKGHPTFPPIAVFRLVSIMQWFIRDKCPYENKRQKQQAVQ